MNVLISNVSVADYNARSIPGLLTITFTNGDIVNYTRSGKELQEMNQLSNFQLPKYVFAEQKEDMTFDALGSQFSAQLRSLGKQYWSAVDTAKRVFLQEKSNIQNLFEQRQKATDDLYESASRELLVEYQKLRKELVTKLDDTQDPEKRLSTAICWLRQTKLPELEQAAEMLQSETDSILKRLNSPEMKWDGFLSHVQRQSADLCGRIMENCKKGGISLWYDKCADRLDTRGMLDGVIDSRTFILVLTKQYFHRHFCIFEYCVALVAGRPIITIFEADARYGGGPVDSFKLSGMFKYLLNHEMIEVHRAYWQGFISKLCRRITKTIKSAPITTMGGKKWVSSSILNEEDVASLEVELRKEGMRIGECLLASSKHGSNRKIFHEKCDGKGPTLIVIESNDAIFGGYTSVSWSSTYGLIRDKTAWLFKLRPFERINITKVGMETAVSHGDHICFGPGTYATSADIFLDFEGKSGFSKRNSYSKGILAATGFCRFNVKQYEVFNTIRYLL